MSVLTAWIQPIFDYIDIPQRLVLSIFGLLAIVNAYTMRQAMDITLPHLISLTNVAEIENATTLIIDNLKEQPHSILQRLSDFNAVRTRSHKQHMLPAIMEESHEWTSSKQFMALKAFNFGYVLTQMPGALLANKYGGKSVLAIGMLATTIFTIFTPAAIEVGGPYAAIALRFCMGLSEGPTFPALSSLLAHWVPANERGKLGVLVLSGGQLGLFMSNLISGLLIHLFDWTYVFYYFGSCGLIWFFGFILLCYNEPESNPFIEDSEFEYLLEHISSVCQAKKLLPTPWRDIFKNGPMWALISATVQYDWTQTLVAAEVPKFIKDIKNLSINENITASIDASVPYILNWIVSLVSGAMSDTLINRNILSTTVTRRIMSFITAIGPNAIMSLSSCISCSEITDVNSIFNCALGLMGTYYAGIKLTPLDLSPNFASILMAIANSLGSLSCLIAPYFQEVIPKHTTFNELRAILLLISAIMISGEVQDFNNPQSLKTE